MNPFQIIKSRIEENVERKSEEQRQRIERLAQLESAQNHKGFNLLNPVQSMKDKTEIKRLKKEIAAFEENKRNITIIVSCVTFVIALICFCGIMAAFEDNSAPSEPLHAASLQEHSESPPPVTVATTVVELPQTQPLDTAEMPTVEATSVTGTTEIMRGDTSTDDVTEAPTEAVLLSPQEFQITWDAKLVDSNHVGSNWSKSFEVDDEIFSSGSVITVAPDSHFTIRLIIQENDSNPDKDYYFERIAYSEELCANGHTISETLYVRENGGRYSGNCAEWNITITITPI